MMGETVIDPPKGTGICVGIDVGVTCNITLGVPVNGVYGVQVFKMYTYLRKILKRKSLDYVNITTS